MARRHAFALLCCSSPLWACEPPLQADLQSTASRTNGSNQSVPSLTGGNPSCADIGALGGVGIPICAKGVMAAFTLESLNPPGAGSEGYRVPGQSTLASFEASLTGLL